MAVEAARASSWNALFGFTSLDEHIDPHGCAGDVYLGLGRLIDVLSSSGDWVSLTDSESGSMSVAHRTARVWQGVSVRNSVLGPNVIVGHGSEVIDCILLDAAKVNHLCAVGRSILGPRASLTAHVVIASHRLDGRDVRLPQGLFSGVDSLPKFGALVGADVVVGPFSLIHPGAVVAPASQWPPYSQLR